MTKNQKLLWGALFVLGVGIVLCMCGCAHRAPLWSHASAEARAAGNFRADAAYFRSPEYAASISNSVNTVYQLRHEVWGEPIP